MQFGPPPRRRKPSLTPMIDVVFLLLVFFMLAARFGQDFELDLMLGTASHAPYSGPPRLVEVLPDGVRLNGADIGLEELAAALAPLMQSKADTVVLQPSQEADLQRAVEVMEALGVAGFSALVLVE